MTIRPETESDREPMLRLARMIAEEGTSFTTDETTDLVQYWFGSGRRFVAEVDGAFAGFYLVRPNGHGRAAHVANASYVVDPAYRGRGIAKMLAEHSIEVARDSGFLAMQFNMVVSTNEHAVRAWQSVGFEIVGTLPKVYRHRELGLVDAYVMHRFL